MLFDLDVYEPFAEFVCCQRCLGGKIDEAFLLHVEFLQLTGQPLALLDTDFSLGGDVDVDVHLALGGAAQVEHDLVVCTLAAVKTGRH